MRGEEILFFDMTEAAVGPSSRSRRDFLRGSAAVALMALLGGFAGKARASETVRLPPLPFSVKALEPYVSARTLEFHHGKHHKAYVDNVNRMIAGTEFAGRPLEEIVKASAGQSETASLFNNAAQAWNHDLYWRSLTPGGGGVPPAPLLRRIESSFDSLEGFRKAWTEAALGQFGSGWAWLALDGGRLRVMKTANADTPLTMGMTPLLVIDVWEHSYYLDYQNRRAEYVRAVLDHLVNWPFASQCLGA